MARKGGQPLANIWPTWVRNQPLRPTSLEETRPGDSRVSEPGRNHSLVKPSFVAFITVTGDKVICLVTIFFNIIKLLLHL